MYIHFTFLMLFKKNKTLIICFAFSIHFIFMHTVISCPAQRNWYFWCFLGENITCSIKFSARCVFFLDQAPTVFPRSRARWVFPCISRHFLSVCAWLPYRDIHLYTYLLTHAHRNMQHTFFILIHILGDYSISAYLKFHSF